MVKGKRVYVIHGDELSSHMEQTQKKGGLSNVVSFTSDIEYKLAHKGAFFYPSIFHLRKPYSVEAWTVPATRGHELKLGNLSCVS